MGKGILRQTFVDFPMTNEKAIQEAAQEIAQVLQNTFQNLFPKHLKQVVLTGSIAQGTFLPEHVDYDLYVLFGEELTYATLETFLQNKLNEIDTTLAGSLPTKKTLRQLYGEFQIKRSMAERHPKPEVEVFRFRYLIIKNGNELSHIDFHCFVQKPKQITYTQVFKDQLAQLEAQGIDTEIVLNEIRRMKRFLHARNLYEQLPGFAGVISEQLILQSGNSPEQNETFKGKRVFGLGTFDKALRWIDAIGYERGQLKPLERIRAEFKFYQPVESWRFVDLFFGFFKSELLLNLLKATHEALE